ncbi:MAG: hypothetical protein CMN85_13695 [Spongiibacteraceae bacterium]|nr:hypothetical protein [Spongiibacteraceae bacterium]|tara:strand:+ start:800 stop:1009 length:210 start_codon:yes stop_codon:yes gene_type:complete
MDSLGYEAETGSNSNEIVAYNCIYHHLAEKHPEVCEFDIAFLESASKKSVTHTECIVRGGHCCRFSIGK